ncbi:oxidoreductase [Martelella alba]|uniref:Oxidoreductase n=1 Tax=Martelella alba TaxID=2590451 RepID=A0ABY2SJK0_9HYPH|nr:oxidoreductase [Martelella alba]TKI05670.1 oxidoreductase [Martelella alba]
MAKTLGIGLIGYGFAAKTFHAPLITHTEGLTLAAVSSSDARKVLADLPTVAVSSQPAAVIADPAVDIVVIPTPNATHFSLAKHALQAGKHVVVDKPFTVTLSQAYELQALADNSKLVLSVFHNRRWDSDFLTVRQLVQDGVLGDVMYFESHYDRFRLEVRARWREQPGAGSGVWYDLGPHLLDQALMLFGTPVAIDVDLARLRPGAQTDDYFHAILIYPQRRVVLHGSMSAAAETPRFTLHGTKGSFVKFGLDPQEEQLKNGLRPSSPDWGRDARDGTLTLAEGGKMTEQSVRTQPGNYPAYYTALRDAILGEGANPVSPAAAIRVMELIELGISSAEQKKTLAVKNG